MERAGLLLEEEGVLLEGAGVLLEGAGVLVEGSVIVCTHGEELGSNMSSLSDPSIISSTPTMVRLCPETATSSYHFSILISQLEPRNFIETSVRVD